MDTYRKGIHVIDFLSLLILFQPLLLAKAYIKIMHYQCLKAAMTMETFNLNPSHPP